MKIESLQTISDPRILKTITISLVTIILLLLSNRLVGIFFAGFKKRSRLASFEQRINTLTGAVQSSISLIIFLTGSLMILKEFGMDITPLLTGAGLFGLAISFGAQTFIRDLIAGFFIIIENQYNIGDSVLINDHKGNVFKINLRTTLLKDQEDNMIYFPNSEIKKVVLYKKNGIKQAIQT